jgi:hypothetical protein
MTGVRSLAHPWGPWGGGAKVRFEQADVRAFGKLRRWGDARVFYLVRLVDDVELFVNASEQESSDEKWLRALGAETRTPSPTRDCGWAIAWREIPS